MICQNCGRYYKPITVIGACGFCGKETLSVETNFHKIEKEKEKEILKKLAEQLGVEIIFV